MKTATLTFYREQLLYDCRQATYVVGDVLKVEEPHDRHQIQDIGEKGNVDLVTRWLDLAMAECVEACYPYSKNPVEDGAQKDDVLVDTNAYQLTLYLPDDFSDTTVQLIERRIHELLVCRVLAYWLAMTHPDKNEAAMWQAKAEDALSGVKDALNARIGRLRRPLRPF